MKLRDYQNKLIADIRESTRKHDRTLAVLPTGGGKTVCFTHIAGSVSAADKRAMIIVHRYELVDQTSKTLERAGIPHGVIAASHPKQFDLAPRVQVASVQTLASRLDRLDWRPDFMIVDEAHHAVAGQWEQALNHYNTKTIGFTATPSRLDGKGLKHAFGNMVSGPTVRWLIDHGFLSRYRVFAPPPPDLSGVSKSRGDYAKAELDAAIQRSTITGDAVAHYSRICPGVPAVAFCTSVDHAKRTKAAFEAAGWKAGLILGEQSKEQRDVVVAQLTAGEIQIICSVDVVSEGFDLPAIGCAILLRPTQSVSLFLQQAGRALRQTDADKVAFFLDHVGNHQRHGFVDDDREWTLDGGHKRPANQNTPQPKQCPECYFYHEPAPACPFCGYEHPVSEAKTRELEEVDGELIELMRVEKRKEQGRAQTLQDLVRIGKDRGYKNPYAWAQFVFKGRKKAS